MAQSGCYVRLGGITTRLTTVRDQHWDLLVVGGGAAGTAIFRDAARRGLKVLLLERVDYAYGTTSRSTRLIHGGLRYLELLDLGLVREGLRERAILLRTAPHLVRPLAFLTPLYEGGRRPPWEIVFGLWLYDLLSPRGSLPRHRVLGRGATLAEEPGLRHEQLLGSVTYYDAQVAFPERLAVESVLDGERHGGVALTRVEVLDLEREQGRVVGVRARDRETGEEHAIRARLVVNATGPWAEELGRLGGEGVPRLRLTKGIHLLVPSFVRHAVVLLAADGRVFFAVPWEGQTLVGTTDTDLREDLDTVQAQADEVRYLVEETLRTFPHAPLERPYLTTAGVRPLVAWREGKASAVSRRHLVWDHARGGTPGLFSVLGVKLTAQRAVAEEVVDRALRVLGLPHRPSDTREAPFPGAPADDWEEFVAQAVAWLEEAGVDPRLAPRIARLYGTRVQRLLHLIRQDRDLSLPLPGEVGVRAEVVLAAQEEGARSTADVLFRRTGAALLPEFRLDTAQVTSEILARLHGWDRARQRQDLEEFEAFFELWHLPPEAVGAGRRA